MKQRLFALVTCGILTLATVGGIGISAFNDIKQETQLITQHIIPKIEAAHSIGSVYRDLRLLLLSHITEKDDFLKKAFSEKIQEVEKIGLTNLAQHNVNTTLYKELTSAYKEYIQVHHEALGFSEKNQTALAEVALYGKALPATQKMERLLRELSDQNIKDEKEVAQRIDHVYQRAVMSFIIGILGSCLFFSLLAWWLLREHSSLKQFTIHAHTDALTGISNRFYFNKQIQSLINNHDKNNGFAFFYMDLNGFKPINDTYGHDAGDKVLKEVANRLKSVLRDSDLLARLGGDEFVFVIPSGREYSPHQVGQRVLKAFEAPMQVDTHTFNVSPSIGVSLYPEHALTAEELMKHADQAMYLAKQIAKQVNKGVIYIWDAELANKNDNHL